MVTSLKYMKAMHFFENYKKLLLNFINRKHCLSKIKTRY